MFVSFLYPYNVKYLNSAYLWVFYKQLSHFNLDEIVFIGNEDYFIKPSILLQQEPIRWELAPNSQAYHEYQVPEDDVIEQVEKYIINSSIFHQLEQKYLSNNRVWKELMTERVPELENSLTLIIEDILKRHQSIDAILTWCNVLSLSFVAEKFNIPVIHNELGALRKPGFFHTAYFDFSGVNGNTEAEKRFEQFQRELRSVSEGKIPILKREDLLLYIANEPNHAEVLAEDTNEYDVGLPLQVEDDSNIIAFSNELNNFELIHLAKKHFPGKVLIRKHPGGYVDYDDSRLGYIDQSVNSIQFIKKCRQIVTINSSTAFEAALLGKKVTVFGEASFKMLSGLDDEREIRERLNFLVFGYLIPYSLLFDKTYYKWRLTRPSETEIYLYHYRYYAENRRGAFGVVSRDSGPKNKLLRKKMLCSFDIVDNHGNVRVVKGELQQSVDGLFALQTRLETDGSEIKIIHWKPTLETQARIKITRAEINSNLVTLNPVNAWSSVDHDLFIGCQPCYEIPVSDKPMNVLIEGEISLIGSYEALQIASNRKDFGQFFTMLKHIRDKKLVIFGTGSASGLISQYLKEPAYYVDNDSKKWGQFHRRVLIKDPRCLAAEDPDQLVIVVASQYYQEIAQNLLEMGFVENHHFWDGVKYFMYF